MSALPVKIKDLSFLSLNKMKWHSRPQDVKVVVVDAEFDSQGMPQSSHSSSPNVQVSCYSFL